MGTIKINNIVYGSSDASEITYKSQTVEEKLDTIPIFDINDNGNVNNDNSNNLTYGHIINALNSDAEDKVLSAKQGKILKNSIDNISEELDNFKNTFLNLVYPIGAVYLSLNSTNPGTLFGGTWEQLQDRFLLGAGSSYSAGSTGGAATHNHNISAGKAWATIGNYSETICFGAGMGSQKWKDWTASIPYYWTHNADAKLTSDQSRYESGTWTNVYGETDAYNNMPPYLTVYMWKRVS